MTAIWDRCHDRHAALHAFIDDVEAGRRDPRIDWAIAPDLRKCFHGVDDALAELEMWWTQQLTAHLDQVFEGLATIEEDEHADAILRDLRSARPGLHAILDAHPDARPVIRARRLERQLLRDAGYRTAVSA